VSRCRLRMGTNWCAHDEWRGYVWRADGYRAKELFGIVGRVSAAPI